MPNKAYIVVRLKINNHAWDRSPHSAETLGKSAVALCEQVHGVEFAFVQPREVSLLVHKYLKFNSKPSDKLFEADIQKMVSACTSIATFEFNRLIINRRLSCVAVDYAEWDDPDVISLHEYKKWLEDFAYVKFDCRVWHFTSFEDVENYFIWRQKDGSRAGHNNNCFVARKHEEDIVNDIKRDFCKWEIMKSSSSETENLSILLNHIG